MKIILSTSAHSVLRFDKGEDLIRQLKKFCIENDIFAGSFQAIGSCQEAILSYYNLESKEYEREFFNQNMEIVGILGNVSYSAEERVIHAHGTIADHEKTPYAGHVEKLIVSATAEVVLSIINGEISRKNNQATGLRLME